MAQVDPLASLSLLFSQVAVPMENLLEGSQSFSDTHWVLPHRSDFSLVPEYSRIATGENSEPWVCFRITGQGQRTVPCSPNSRATLYPLIYSREQQSKTFSKVTDTHRSQYSHWLKRMIQTAFPQAWAVTPRAVHWAVLHDRGTSLSALFQVLCEKASSLCLCWCLYN
jgi:hypothetical protein